MKNPGKYILIGIPGCGKSTLGRRIADTLQLPFFDTDSMVKESLQLDGIVDFFRAVFNGRFSVEQVKVMYKLAKVKGPAIIATGAEVALIPECAKTMKKMGTTIHIQRKPELVLADLKNGNKDRLVLLSETDGPEVTMQEESVKLYAQEYDHYVALADLTLENDGSEDEGFEKLAGLINRGDWFVDRGINKP